MIGAQAAVPEKEPMKEIRIAKLVLNVGVGKSGEALERAKRMLTELTGQTPSPRKSRQTIRDFGIHRGEPIGVMTTLRGSKATEILKRLLLTKGNRLPASSFDSFGNCSLGIKEHIEIPGVKYNPEIGIFGLTASISLERPGYRVARRRRATSRIGRRHRVTKEAAQDFFRRQLGVVVF